MASGGVLTIFEENTHCTPCNSNDKTVAFNHYCFDCEAYFCNECFEFHLRIPYLATHIVLEKKEVKVWSNLQYKCKPHERKFEFFCRNHKKLCCHICVSLQHRSCDKVDYIPECANEKRLKKEVTSMTRSIDDNLQKINTYKEKFQMKLSTNEHSKQCCMNAITDYRKRINSILDELEAKTKDMTEEKFEKNSMYSTENSYELRQFECRLKTLNQQLHTSSKGMEILVYIGLLEGTAFVEDMERKISQMDISNTKEDFGLVLDDQLERFLNNISRFGYVKDNRTPVEEVSSDEIPEDVLNETITFTPNDAEIESDVAISCEQQACFTCLKHEIEPLEVPVENVYINITDTKTLQQCERPEVFEKECSIEAASDLVVLGKDSVSQQCEQSEVFEETECIISVEPQDFDVQENSLSQQCEQSEVFEETECKIPVESQAFDVPESSLSQQCQQSEVFEETECKIPVESQAFDVPESTLRTPVTRRNQELNDQCIQIFVNLCDGRRTLLDVRTTDTIAEVKAKLIHKSKIVFNTNREFLLIYGLHSLGDEYSVGNLHQHCTLNAFYYAPPAPLAP